MAEFSRPNTGNKYSWGRQPRDCTLNWDSAWFHRGHDSFQSRKPKYRRCQAIFLRLFCTSLLPASNIQAPFAEQTLELQIITFKNIGNKFFHQKKLTEHEDPRSWSLTLELFFRNETPGPDFLCRLSRL